MLAGFGAGECIDPCGEVQLLAEVSCPDEDLCRRLQDALLLLPCQVEWQQTGTDFTAYVLGDKGADQDHLLATLATFLDGRPNQLRLIETKMVQNSPDIIARHGFHFVSNNDPIGPRNIVLVAGSHAFGSGHHPSTSLVVELLEELPEIPSPVLDVGCGTGVLSIVVARLGARQVVGVDIDEEAVMVASENARANNLADRLSFSTSPLHEVAGSFSLILANVTASVLYRLMAALTSKAEPGAWLIVSGLQGRQGDEAVEAVAKYGWRLDKRRALGKWQARVFVKVPGH